MMAVLETFWANLKLQDQDIPIRLVCPILFPRKTRKMAMPLIFEVANSVVVREVLERYSFENWMAYLVITEPAIIGTVTSLWREFSFVNMRNRLKATGNYSAEYIRGPWFKVGEDSFKTKSWCFTTGSGLGQIDDEWTAAKLTFLNDPWALRVAPTSPI